MCVPQKTQAHTASRSSSDGHLGNNVFVIAVVIVTALKPYPLVSPFGRAFMPFESLSHWDPCCYKSSWHLRSHTSPAVSCLGKFLSYLARSKRFKNVGAVTQQCMVLVILIMKMFIILVIGVHNVYSLTSHPMPTSVPVAEGFRHKAVSGLISFLGDLGQLIQYL